MEMKAVNSSNIVAIGYESGLLSVRFKSGAECDYSDVPAEKVGLLMTANSIGGYFSSEIRGRYELVRNTPPALLDDRLGLTRELVAPLPMPMITAEPDDCCKPMRCDLSKLQTWECPECGCEWRPTVVGPLRHWRPVPAVLVFQALGTAERE